MIPTYETLLALFRAFQAAGKAWHARPTIKDLTNMKSEANLAILAERTRLSKAQDAALEALTAEYERTVPDRERALVDAGQGTACCCCDGITGAEVWCNVTFGAGE
jgi:hypothetical protein